jgi:hypothetical protein
METSPFSFERKFSRSQKKHIVASCKLYNFKSYLDGFDIIEIDRTNISEIFRLLKSPIFHEIEYAGERFGLGICRMNIIIKSLLLSTNDSIICIVPFITTANKLGLPKSKLFSNPGEISNTSFELLLFCLEDQFKEWVGKKEGEKYYFGGIISFSMDFRKILSNPE